MTDKHLSPDELLAAIAPKSDRLNADDLIAGPITVTITDVIRSDDKNDKKPVIQVEGHLPYRPCKTMARIMVIVWGKESWNWSGNKVTLYRDPEVVYGGQKVGGIRISHMSGLDGPRTFSVTKSKQQKVSVTIQPIATLTPEEKKYIDVSSEELARSANMETLRAHGEILKNKSKPIQDALRPVYAKRKDELEAQDSGGNGA